MSSSTSLQKFQLNWKPSKQILLLQSIMLFTALLCITLTSFSLLIKCIMVLLAIVYAKTTLSHYWHYPETDFFVQHKQLYAQMNRSEANVVKHYRWFDWGFVYVLEAEYAGNIKQWIWLRWHLSDDEKRNLSLMIRLFLKKECHSIPSIITNPVL